MKLASLLALTGLAFTATAHAGLPRASVSRMALAVHGIYLTSDPTCQTGLVPSVPLNLSATTVDFTNHPALGAGSIPSSIACVVFVTKNSLGLSWPAGTYTTTTPDHSNVQQPDSVCNSGGTIDQFICHDSTPAFPARIVADAAAIGMTLTTNRPNSPSGNEIVPIYLSVNSACSGGATDPGGCRMVNSGNGSDTFNAPTSAGDQAHGIKIPAVAGGYSSYTFVSDPDGTAVGNDGGTCGSIGPPLFSFRPN